MLYGVSNSSNTTGSTYNLVFMQRSISLYRALKNTRFSSTSPTRIFGDFWYVIEDMFLNQKPLKNLLLQLVAGWPTFCDKMPGLTVVPGIGSFAALFPKSLHLLKKQLGIDQDKFIKYVVCPKCDTLYKFDDCYELQNRKRVSRKCTFIEFPNTGSIFAGHSVMSHSCEKSHWKVARQDFILSKSTAIRVLETLSDTFFSGLALH